MPGPTARTVLVYPNDTVVVVRGHHNINDPLLTVGGLQPHTAYYVMAGGDTDALRRALVEKEHNTVPDYLLSVGEQADINLHRLALRLGISEADVLRNAINTYATLKNNQHEEVFVRTRNAQGVLVVKRVVLP